MRCCKTDFFFKFSFLFFLIRKNFIKSYVNGWAILEREGLLVWSFAGLFGAVSRVVFFAIFRAFSAVFQFWKCPAVRGSSWKPVRFLWAVIFVGFSVLLIFPPFSQQELTARPRGFDFSAFRFSPLFLAFYRFFSDLLAFFGFWPHMQEGLYEKFMVNVNVFCQF